MHIAYCGMCFLVTCCLFCMVFSEWTVTCSRVNSNLVALYDDDDDDDDDDACVL